MPPPITVPSQPPANVLPAGWMRTPAPPAGATLGSARSPAYARQDGAEVFFDRRTRSDEPMEALHPGWVWLARRADGQVLGHCVSGAAGSPGGLFLPRKFRSAFEAMRALDLETPLPPTASVNAASVVTAGAGPARPAGGLNCALALLESTRPDLHGPGGALLPRLGVAWAQVDFHGPILLAALPPLPGNASGGHPRAALATAATAAAHRCPVVALGAEDVQMIRALLQKLVAKPGVTTAREVRAFLDLAIHRDGGRPHGGAKPAVVPGRKRIPLGDNPRAEAA